MIITNKQTDEEFGMKEDNGKIDCVDFLLLISLVSVITYQEEIGIIMSLLLKHQ